MSRKCIVLLFSIVLLSLSPVPLRAAELTGDRIIAAIDELTPTVGKFTMDLTIIRPGKDNRTSRIQVFIKGSDKILVRYLAPAEEKGQGYLRLGENEWLYLPDANKSIRVSGRQSMQGSDLANDDILKLKMTADYDAQITGAETIGDQTNYVLELTARRPSAAYGKLKYWVRKGDLLPSKTEYYAVSGKLIKTMTYSQIREIGGRVRPAMMEIASELRKGYKTTMTIIDADFNFEIPDGNFTRMYLEKGK